MTSHSDMALNDKGRIPWYLYFVGGMVYIALGGWLFAESSPLGFFYAWRRWQQETEHRGNA